MRKIVDYAVVQDDDFRKFMHACMKCIERGYEPTGGISPTPADYSSGSTSPGAFIPPRALAGHGWMQAFVKYAEESTKIES